jgi:hypothetical protein
VTYLVPFSREKLRTYKLTFFFITHSVITSHHHHITRVSKDNLEPSLTWLQARLKLDDKGLSFVIQRSPSLLGYNMDTNLEPTIKFYEDCVGSTAAIHMIVEDPRILGSSLEKRLKPRLAECQEAGIPIDTSTLPRISTLTAEKWSASMAQEN